MSGYRKKIRNKLPPFVALTWEMLNSEAYKALSHSAAKALPYFLGKVKLPDRDPHRYISVFSFSYTEGKRFGFATSTFHKVIQELVGKGVIDPVDKGGLRSNGKSYNLFRLSERWRRYGTNEFESRDWKCFNPKPRLKATSKSETYNFKKGNEMSLTNENVSQTETVEAVLP
jgi:hypothetical protein